MPVNCVLFNHLAGFGEQPQWHRQSERLGCPQIDQEIEFGRLHDPQVGGLFALEDPADGGGRVRQTPISLNCTRVMPALAKVIASIRLWSRRSATSTQ